MQWVLIPRNGLLFLDKYYFRQTAILDKQTTTTKNSSRLLALEYIVYNIEKLGTDAVR